MRARRLTKEEAALWARLAVTVTPLAGRRRLAPAGAVPPVPAPPASVQRVSGPVSAPPAPPPPAVPPRPLDRGGLDAGWERRLSKGTVAPDFTLDLHGASLDAAYIRLEQGLALALAQGARTMLVITGRPRTAPDASDRGSRRGAIRAKLLDWLAHGAHAGRIATVRGAHPRHGGPGAVYIVLRRVR